MLNEKSAKDEVHALRHDVRNASDAHADNLRRASKTAAAAFDRAASRVAGDLGAQLDAMHSGNAQIVEAMSGQHSAAMERLSEAMADSEERMASLMAQDAWRREHASELQSRGLVDKALELLNSDLRQEAKKELSRAVDLDSCNVKAYVMLACLPEGLLSDEERGAFADKAIRLAATRGAGIGQGASAEADFEAAALLQSAFGSDAALVVIQKRLLGYDVHAWVRHGIGLINRLVLDEDEGTVRAALLLCRQLRKGHAVGILAAFEVAAMLKLGQVGEARVAYDAFADGQIRREGNVPPAERWNADARKRVIDASDAEVKTQLAMFDEGVRKMAALPEEFSAEARARLASARESWVTSARSDLGAHGGKQTRTAAFQGVLPGIMLGAPVSCVGACANHADWKAGAVVGAIAGGMLLGTLRGIFANARTRKAVVSIK